MTTAGTPPQEVPLPPPEREEAPSAVTVTEVKVVTETITRSPLLSSLLRMADTYRAEGSLHQAAEIYFKLVEEHDGTPEAIEATQRLMEMSAYYECIGELRQARSIVERLL